MADGTAEVGCESVSGFGNGPFRTVREDGTLLNEGTRTGGVLTGDYTWFCADGSVRVRERYTPGKKRGFTVENLEQGSCPEEGSGSGLF